MKRFWAILLLLVFLPTTGALAAKPIIRSDQQYLDPTTGLYVLKGNVYIETSNRIITAGEARVDMVGMEVWGNGGITLKQDDISFSGDSVYVYGTKKQADITGKVRFARNGLSIESDQVVYNWQTKRAVFSGNVLIRQNSTETSVARAVYHVIDNVFLE